MYVNERGQLDLSLALPHTDLMKSAPDLMTEALTTHDAIIQAAKWSTCGSIIEQEGDSFVIVFHEAMDAMQFCLQVREGECMCSLSGTGHVRVGCRAISRHLCLISCLFVAYSN